jgi:hypothetical protein
MLNTHLPTLLDREKPILPQPRLNWPEAASAFTTTTALQVTSLGQPPWIIIEVSEFRRHEMMKETVHRPGFEMEW